MLAERVRIWAKPSVEQGLLQGRREGAYLLLCTLLRRRFGDLPEWVEASLSAADEQQPDHWADRILDAPTLEAVFAQSTNSGLAERSVTAVGGTAELDGCHLTRIGGGIASLERVDFPRDMAAADMTQIDDLADVVAMLADGEQRWLKPWFAQGLLQGRREGASLLLCRLLHRRFGDLPEWVEARLNAADEVQLGHWADRILDAPTLDAVFAASSQVGIDE